MTTLNIMKYVFENITPYEGAIGNTIFLADKLDSVIHWYEKDPDVFSKSDDSLVIITRDGVKYEGFMDSCAGPYLATRDSIIYITPQEIYVNAPPRSIEMMLAERVIGTTLPQDVSEVLVKKNYAYVSNGKIFSEAPSIKKSIRAYEYMKKISEKHLKMKYERFGYSFGSLSITTRRASVEMKATHNELLRVLNALEKKVRGDIESIEYSNGEYTVLFGTIFDGASFASKDLDTAIERGKELFYEKDYTFVFARDGSRTKIYDIPVDAFYFETEHDFSYKNGKVGYYFNSSNVSGFLKDVDELPVENWYKDFIHEEVQKIEKIMNF